MLCENSWKGGLGYTPQEVGQMTLDQVWFCLCDVNNLKKDIGKRTQKSSALNSFDLVRPNKDGLIAGRDKDGKPMMGRIKGMSKARALMNKKQAAKQEVRRKTREERIKEKEKLNKKRR